MLKTLIIFMPVVTCAFWILIHILEGFRIRSFGNVVTLLIFTALFLFSDSCYTDVRTNWSIITTTGLIAQFATPCIIPIVGSYLKRLRNDPGPHPLQLLWIIAPAALLTSGLLLYFISGDTAIQQFNADLEANGSAILKNYKGTTVMLYFISTAMIYRLVIALELLVFIVTGIHDALRDKSKFSHVIGFFFRGERIHVKGLQLFNIVMLWIVICFKLVLFEQYINDHQWTMALAAILMTIGISAFSYTALFSSKPMVSLKEMVNGWKYNYSPENKSEIIKEHLEEILEDADDSIVSHIQEITGGNPAPEDQSEGEAVEETKTVTGHLFDAVADNPEDDSLRGRFQHLMVDENLFLMPRLSLNDVAERLHSNKTYVSKMVNNTYNLGFPELINTLRVDYAEQYILNHRNARQDEIATACGFLSASSFNNTFKKITGMTPKMWVANEDRKSETKADSQ